MNQSFVPQSDVALAPYTTLAVGGAAAYFADVATDAELVAAYDWAAANAVPVTVLGGGSNVLVSDQGVSGLVVRVTLYGRQVDISGDRVIVSYRAGEVFDAVVADTVREGWWGLENLSHIPGTVGATPVQNVGAYGVEVADSIVRVRVYDYKQRTFYELTAEECAFSYRHSLFKQPAYQHIVVTDVVFSLSLTPKPVLDYKDLQPLQQQSVCTQHTIRDTVIQVREGKFPDWHRVGTAGSFFKNPIISSAEYESLREQFPDVQAHRTTDGQYKVALGWVLDAVCGLRGYRRGSVGLYEKQALVLINHGGTSATEVEDFATEVARLVYDKTRLTVEWEVTRI